MAARLIFSLTVKPNEPDASIIVPAQTFWVYFDIRAEVFKSEKSQTNKLKKIDPFFFSAISNCLFCLFWYLLTIFFLLFCMASFKQAGPKSTNYISVILQGGEHSPFDPGGIRSNNLLSGLWNYLCMETLALAPWGFRASMSLFCEVQSIFVLWFSASTAWTTCSPKDKTVVIPPKVAVQQCEGKVCIKFCLIGNISAWLSFHQMDNPMKNTFMPEDLTCKSTWASMSFLKNRFFFKWRTPFQLKLCLQQKKRDNHCWQIFLRLCLFPNFCLICWSC